MPLPITAIYAAILSVLLMALAVNVTVHRGKLGVSLGPGDNPVMLRMIRIHGNAAEYIPIALLLMAVYEINGGSHAALHISGIGLVVGRLLHAWGMWTSPIPNFGRVAGQTLTWLAVVILALLNLLRLV